MNDSPDHRNTSQNERFELLQRWLFDIQEETSALEPASSDASFRRYFRVKNGTKSTIAMDAAPAQNKNEAFIALANQLKSAGINTPTVLEFDRQHGFILMEDFGDIQYLHALNKNNADELYSAAIATLAKLQSALSYNKLPAYDADFLKLEMHLLPEWYFERHRGLALSKAQLQVLESVFSLCCDSALEQPRCFVHRDYHSRNLMLTDTNYPGILDFQDAVQGPLTYDIASLLRDCYISWPDDFVYAKLEQHRQLCMASRLTTADAKQYQRWFDLIALQRHIKVMGIFCRLKIRDGKTNYMQDLPLVISYIHNTCNRYPELADFLQLLEDTGTLQEFS